MASEKIEVTYVFGFGRSDLISSNEKFANDFFYGYFNFLKKYKNIKFLEFNDNKKSVLSIISKILRKLTKLSFFIENICSVHNFKILWKTKHIIATNDRIGVSLMPFLIVYKFFNVNKTSVIVMGLLAKETTNIINHILQRLLLNIFFYLCSDFIFLSKSELKQAQVSYKRFKHKFHFIPFCIDTEFWKIDKDKNFDRNKIIFVGNDGRRDYDLVLKIAKELPEYEFLVITSNIDSSELLSQNVELVKGSWNKRILSDDDLKRYYQKSLLSIIPINNTYQPSGQSVALQSMAMGVPVMITDTIGFWDREIFRDKDNIFFATDNNLNTWVENIKNIINNPQIKDLVSENGNKTVNQSYNSEFFYESLEKILFKPLN